jgi:hypothetical protein
MPRFNLLRGLTKLPLRKLPVSTRLRFVHDRIGSSTFAAGKRWGYPNRAILDFIADVQHGRSSLTRKINWKVGGWIPARTPHGLAGHRFFGNQFVKVANVRSNALRRVRRHAVKTVALLAAFRRKR